MKTWHYVGYILVIVGALNWGLIGLFNFNLVNLVFGSVPWLERLLYILIGIFAVYDLVTHKGTCKYCGKK